MQTKCTPTPERVSHAVSNLETFLHAVVHTSPFKPPSSFPSHPILSRRISLTTFSGDADLVVSAGTYRPTCGVSNAWHCIALWCSIVHYTLLRSIIAYSAVWCFLYCTVDSMSCTASAFYSANLNISSANNSLHDRSAISILGDRVRAAPTDARTTHGPLASTAAI